LSRLKQTYPQEDPNKEVEEVGLEPEDQMELRQNIQNIKSFVFRCYIKFNALKTQINQFGPFAERIEAQYQRIATAAIPTKDDVEQFTITLNEVFVQGIVGELLGTAGDVMRGLTQPTQV